MSQKLIQPINKMIVSAGFLNDAYAKKFGFKHWGYDCYGESTVYAQGHGIVVATGTDSCYGNFVMVYYPQANGDKDIIASYFHFSSVKVSNGQFVSKDTPLGIIGMTGTYATGIHLHTEMREYRMGDPRMISPFTTQYFTKNIAVTWINPLNIIHCKGSAPDNQTRTFSDTTYTNIQDRQNILKI